MRRRKFIVIALAILAFGFACAPRSNAGTDMVIDNSAQAPPPTAPPPVAYYPPPPPVYYAPPAIGVGVGFFPARRFFGGPRFVVVRRFHPRRVVVVR